ncbi:hypothetical protein B6D60_02250 [candidate division KSB1 bacterium 4484_87]|nr:MAG: hypothetical protein B6D60_02250 [candidate division KSB1 bacterium 4484_87]
MNEEEIVVIFQPKNKTIKVPAGTDLIDAAEKANIIIPSPCGRIGKCGKCKVKITNVELPFTLQEEYWLTPDEREQGVHLACQVKVHTPLVVETISEEKATETKILTYDLATDFDIDNHLQKKYVDFQTPTLENQIDDFKNLKTSALGDNNAVDLPLAIFQNLPSFLRKNEFRATVVLENNHILALESSDTSERLFGVAFDLGTTTIVGSLVNMYNGEILAIAARTNPQAKHGADVISRVKYATSEPGGLGKLQSSVVESINEIIDELCEKSSVSFREIYELSLAGNTIMNHLFLGVSPRYIAEAPYIPAFRQSQRFHAEELGITIQPRGSVVTLPNISGYVGGDIVGFILASSIHKADKITLGIDIGTNGEIVLGNKERLLCCSAAAGPAFEGGQISSGMRATEGAIDKVTLGNDQVFYHVIGDTDPKGICGTALVDAVAELLRVGIINETGRIVVEETAKFPDWLQEKIVSAEKKIAFNIADTNRQDRVAVQITQQDIRELQLGKGAIAAGIEIMCKELGISTSDIEEILIAGAFGSYLNKNNARAIGLIPNVPLERVKYVGNAASLGAKKFLLSKRERDEAEKIIRQTEYIELSSRLDFQEVFAEKMFFEKI